MSADGYLRLLDEVNTLSRDEQLLLIEGVARRLRGETGRESHPRWEDSRGTAPYPLCGEDAQAWVTRDRSASDEARKA